MQVLVVGATGYIGSVVADRLQSAGHSVVALVKDGSSVDRLPSGSVVRYGDLTDTASLSAALVGVDGVVDLATPTGDAGVDAAAVEAMLAPLRGTGRPFVYTSGVWVLGRTGPAPADEDAPTNPLPIVGYRPEIERQVLAAAGDGVRSVVIRPGIVHGRGGGIPALLVALARELGTGRYVGDDSVRWPMVHVDDLADLFVAALEQAPAGTLLHGVDEPGVPVVELAHAAAQAAGVTGAELWPLADAAGSLGEPFAEALALSQTCSGERARRILAWRPRRPGAVADVSSGSYAAVPVP